MWNEIIELANQHDYMGGIQRDQYRVKQTAEVFTPTELVVHLCKKLIEQNPQSFAPRKNIIDPACGDGQFLIVALGIKMYHHGMSREESLQDIYGVDILRDNVDLCKRRLGGGHIVMGNALDPTTRIKGQTDKEYATMHDWFSDDMNLESFF
jgi:hypothetical protein